MLVWGKFVATVAIESYSVAYKLFSPAGLPLRATLSVSFREHTPRQFGELLKNLSSPDINHVHTVREGDRLPTVVHGIYRNPAYYIAVARANRLDTVRQLPVGGALYLPPVR
jgi:hypothetical protein